MAANTEPAAKKTDSKRKRAPNSPDISDHHKKYLLDNSSLLENNKFYLPSSAEKSLSQEPVLSQQQKPTGIKIPPIYVHEVNNYRAIIDDIESLIENEFSTESKTNSVKIMLTDKDDFRKLTNFYDEKKIKYHTFQDPDKTVMSVVIRGIPVSISEKDILEVLQDKYPVRTVTRLLNKDKRPMPLCAIDLDKSDNAMEIYNVTHIMHSIVSVEPRRKSKEIPQCTRCQRFGHTKNYCKLTPRCVKCQENHHFSTCPKRREEPPVCVNCGENHAASYRGCLYYKNLKSKIHKTREQNNSQRTAENFQNAPPNNITPENSTTNFPRRTYHQNFDTQHHPRPRNYAEATTGTPSYMNLNNQQSSTSQDSILTTIINLLVELVKPHLDQIKSFLTQLIPQILRNVTI